MESIERLDSIIKKQIRLCLKYRHFRSLIFISTRAKMHNMFKYLENFFENNWFVKRNIVGLMRCSSNSILVRFKNGSYIKVIPATENARGHRANNVVIDADVKNQEIIHYIISPMIRGLFIERPKLMAKLSRIKPYRIKNFKRTEYIVKI